jgi:hypothetical protein
MFRASLSLKEQFKRFTRITHGSVAVVTRLSGKIAIAKICLLSVVSRPILSPNQPPMSWVLWSIPWGFGSGGIKLTADLHLVLRFRMFGAVLAHGVVLN